MVRHGGNADAGIEQFVMREDGFGAVYDLLSACDQIVDIV